MSKPKFIAFLLLVGVWMPGSLAVYMWWLSGQKNDAHIFIGLVVFLYSIFAPNIIHSFWDEFAKHFGRKTDDTRRERE
jgi:hypothetical protein